MVWTFFSLIRWDQAGSKVNFKKVAIVVVIGIVLGAITELAQIYIPRRTPGFDDFFADVSGVLFGALLLIFLKKQSILD